MGIMAIKVAICISILFYGTLNIFAFINMLCFSTFVNMLVVIRLLTVIIINNNYTFNIHESIYRCNCS